MKFDSVIYWYIWTLCLYWALRKMYFLKVWSKLFGSHCSRCCGSKTPCVILAGSASGRVWEGTQPIFLRRDHQKRIIQPGLARQKLCSGFHNYHFKFIYIFCVLGFSSENVTCCGGISLTQPCLLALLLLWRDEVKLTRINYAYNCDGPLGIRHRVSEISFIIVAIVYKQSSLFDFLFILTVLCDTWASVYQTWTRCMFWVWRIWFEWRIETCRQRALSPTKEKGQRPAVRDGESTALQVSMSVSWVGSSGNMRLKKSNTEPSTDKIPKRLCATEVVRTSVFRGESPSCGEREHLCSC